MRFQLFCQLFTSFFKIGSVAFGGGYTVIPLLQREVVEYRKWVTNEELAEIMAISQTLPGIIMVNSATMVGSRIGKFWGAFAATTAAILPTFIITLFVTAFFWKYTTIPLIKKILTGILLGVTSLIIYSITKTWASIIQTNFDIFLAIFSASILLFFKINVVYVIIVTTVLGFIYNLIQQRIRGNQ